MNTRIQYKRLLLFLTSILLVHLGGSVEAVMKWECGNQVFSLQGHLKHQTGLRITDPDSGDLSILRTTLQFEPDVKFSDRFSWHAIFRTVRDGYDQYDSEEDWLDDDYWNEDDLHEVLRELYFDAALTKNLTIRVGRQQIVWGETDGFRMLDIVNPLDQSWHALGESWEDQRIPLWALKTTIGIQKYAGTLEIVFIPGWDKKEDRVNKFAPSPPILFDEKNWRLYYDNDQRPHWGTTLAPVPGVITFPATNVVSDWPESNGIQQWQGGFRWLGDFKGVTYSIADFYSFSYSPVAKYQWGLGTFAPTGDPATWVDGVPVVTDVILDYPRTNMIGGSFNWYSNALNTVFRGEVGYWDALEYNTGNLGPFSNGVIKKNTLKYMLGTDGNYFIKLLNPNRTWYVSTQMFQTVILNYDEDDELLEIGSYPVEMDQFETIFTLFVIGNYRQDNISPQALFAWDVDGSWWVHAYVNFTIGDHWRLTPGVQVFGGNDQFESLGLFRKNDEAYLNIIYQF